MKQITAYLVRHTHWDREWYLPFSEFRIKLVRLVDELMDQVQSDPEGPSFMLDGQSVVLEDYLEIRPENRQKLIDAVQAGRIIVGPWYILPDELLVSGESHIRNYLYGKKTCAEYGRKSNIGYLPDSFGHPSQMPQLIDGLGLDAMLFWRGTANFMKQTEFYWESPDSKKRILCIHMPRGYGNGACFSANMTETVERLDETIETLASLSSTDVVLIMNGSDHLAPQTGIEQIVEEYNKRTKKPYHIVMGTLAEFISAVKERVSDIETYRGEFCYGDRTLLLGGTLSTRSYLKQKQNEVEKTMERYLEPIAALETMTRGAYRFRGYADDLWRKILKNEPHDSICGCSIDEVHRAMVARYEEIAISEKTQYQALCASLCEPCQERQDGAVKLLLFEPTQDGLTGVAEAAADFDPVLIREVNYAKSEILEYEDQIQHPAAPECVRVFDETGRELPCEILETKKAEFLYLTDKKQPETYLVNRTRLLIQTGGLSYGMHVLKAQKTDAAMQRKLGFFDQKLIENQRYRVSFDENGFRVQDKKTGKVHENVCRLIDVGDAGDEYTYSWPENDAEFVCFKADEIDKNENALRCELTVHGTLEIPESLTEDRKSRSAKTVCCPVVLKATLENESNRIGFTCEIENFAKDHRLQAAFPSGILSETSSSYSTYAVTERPVRMPVPEHYEEYPCQQHVCHGYASVSDGKDGLTAAAKGIYEYEAKNDRGQTWLLFTMLRCVGWLSRPDLLTRHGNGGWMLSTPEAQCLGKYRFEMSIVYHEGTLQKSGVYREADRFLHPQAIYPMFRENYTGGNPLAFLSELPRAIRVTSVKTAEDGDGIIIRMVNLTEKPMDFTLNTGYPAIYTNLAEETETIVPGGIKNELHIDGAQILTIKLEINK